MEESMHRIHRIELPVPFPIQTTNAYLVDDEPLTLIDTGLKTSKSFSILEDSLRAWGYRIGDIRRILITHGHVDHYGQAGEIAAFSGARIHMHRKEHERIQSLKQFGNRLTSVLIRNGIPRDSLDEAMTYMKSTIETLADPINDVCTIHDGDTIAFKNMTLRSILCPGHSPGLTCFYLEKEGILFSGDHLLEKISPNPIIDPSNEGPGRQSQSLKAYLHSIERIRNLKVSFVLPGHGNPIRDFRGALERAIDHHTKRLSTVRAILTRGEMTAYEVARVLFPCARGFEEFLGVSEILGHLRILVDEGKVTLASRDGMDYYSASLEPLQKI